MKTIKMKLSSKIALLAFVFSIFGIASLAIISYKQSNEIFKNNLISSTDFEVRKLAKNFTEKINESKKDILFLAHSEPVLGILRTTKNKYNYDEQENMHLDSWKERLKKLFIVIMGQNEAYYQFRLIGVQNGGKEVIRVEKKDNGIVVIPEEDLQIKNKRSYYQDTLKLAGGDVYISKINLNKEHHVISIPHIPTVRIATPIYNGDEVYAVLVINIDVNKLLEFKKLDTTENKRIVVANEEGYYVYNRDVEKTFSFEFGGRQYRIQDEYDIGEYMGKDNSDNYSFYDENLSSAVSIQKVDFSKDRFIYVMEISNSEYFKNEAQSYIKVLGMYILIIAVIIAFLIAFLLRYLISPISQLTDVAKKITQGEDMDLSVLDIKTGDEIEELSTSFKYMVTSLSESKQKLQELANNLEVEVEKKTKELRKLNAQLEEKIDEALVNSEKIKESKYKIEKVYQQTQESIEYAALIQNALLPKKEPIGFTKDCFIYWKPKDTVGGDIYFISKLNEHEVLFMVIDGAGHGVAGAFLTMLVKAIEERIVASIKEGTLKPSPALILSYFNKSIKTMLKQEKGSRSNVGFDGGILYYNKAMGICKYAGAKTPLYIIRDNRLEIVKGDRKHVGFVRTRIDQAYADHDIEIKPGTKLYIATDGIIDQEGKNGTRYGRKRFESFILSHHRMSFETQYAFLRREFLEFKADRAQSDDITVLGMELADVMSASEIEKIDTQYII